METAVKKKEREIQAYDNCFNYHKHGWFIKIFSAFSHLSGYFSQCLMNLSIIEFTVVPHVQNSYLVLYSTNLCVLNMHDRLNVLALDRFD